MALRGAMKEYVETDDGYYKYELVDEIEEEGYTTYVIRMVSQKWLTEEEVNNPVWWHWLTMVVPDEVNSDHALLFIRGGSTKSKQPDKADELLVQTALTTKSVAASLHNVPFQPTEFVGDNAYGRPERKEDEIIAYGWRKFLEGGGKLEDTKWLARLPMTKAAVKSMDTMTDFTEKMEGVPTVEKFVVAGASKRGWTTWTSAVVDDRVVAIAPAVIDVLNMFPSFDHHHKVYGYWVPAFGNYTFEGILDWQDSEEFYRLSQVTEPFTFREQLTLPKLILNSTGDEFFVPDSWQFYWDELKGEKHIRSLPNTNHSMKGTDVFETLVAFYQMVITDTERPNFDWEVVNGKIHLQTQATHPPSNITLWQANNPKARNFQLDTIGKAFQPTNIPIREDGKYVLTVDEPQKGYTAFFAELTFPGLGVVPLKLTSGVVVTPDVYPFEVYESSSPKGKERKESLTPQ